MEKHEMIGTWEGKNVILTCPECGHKLWFNTKTHDRVTLIWGKAMEFFHSWAIRFG